MKGGKAKYLLEVRNIIKTFGKVVALDHINMCVGHNDVVGLIGDNGAGKSTLIKVIMGVYKPDGGEIFFNGGKIENLSISKVQKIGIETVYQERALVEQQTIARNIFLGREITNMVGLINHNLQGKIVTDLLRSLAFRSAISPDSIVGDLSGGERQGVAIARSLLFKSKLIILDEPTTGLSLSETKRVLEFIIKVKKGGKSCIFITHNIYHVYPVADKFIILDRGKKVAEFAKKDVSKRDLENKLLAIASEKKKI